MFPVLAEIDNTILFLAGAAVGFILPALPLYLRRAKIPADPPVQVPSGRASMAPGAGLFLMLLVMILLTPFAWANENRGEAVLLVAAALGLVFAISLLL
jgi:hypothetical protein